MLLSPCSEDAAYEKANKYIHLYNSKLNVLFCLEYTTGFMLVPENIVPHWSAVAKYGGGLLIWTTKALWISWLKLTAIISDVQAATSSPQFWPGGLYSGAACLFFNNASRESDQFNHRSGQLTMWPHLRVEGDWSGCNIELMPVNLASIKDEDSEVELVLFFFLALWVISLHQLHALFAACKTLPTVCVFA